jgi:outer membrane protein TolC
MPLFLRKERGALQLADIKLAETDWQLKLKQQALQAKMEVYIASLATLERQVVLGVSVVDQYRQLFEAERIKFEAGGSSIFYLNVRQQKLLESKMKLLKLQTERHKMQASLIWSSGNGYR